MHRAQEPYMEGEVGVRVLVPKSGFGTLFSGARLLPAPPGGSRNLPAPKARNPKL